MRVTIRGLVLAATLVVPALASAQDPGPPRQLRERVEAVFFSRLKQDLGLDDAQAQKVGAVLTDWGGKRRELELGERRLRQGLDGQLRPGVAADNDSLTQLVDGLLQNRVDYALSFQGEMRDLSAILTPVQRAQFLRMRDQLLRRVQDLQEQRRDGAPVGPRRP